jgi:hypothetical protein
MRHFVRSALTIALLTSPLAAFALDEGASSKPCCNHCAGCVGARADASQAIRTPPEPSDFVKQIWTASP